MTHPREAKYNKSFEQHGQSPKALQWASYRSAAVRYKQLVADIQFEGKTILDAGCGMGDIVPYIHAKTDNFDYTGVDPTKVFIDTASKRYEGHRFIVADPFIDTLDGAPFDIVLCSGELNANSGDWLAERKRMISQLFDLSEEALAFNMAGSFDTVSADSASTVAYADASDILEFCKTLTSKLIVRSNYHRRDFTIVLFK